MKLIDDRGKIFGLINYIDLAFILLIVFIIGKFALTDQDIIKVDKDKNMHKTEITYLISEVRMVSIDNINVGDEFTDTASNEVIGTVIDKEIKRAEILTTDQNGETVYSEIPDKFDMYLKIEGEAEVTDNEIKIGDEELKIGKMATIHSKLSAFEAIIYSIEYN